VELEIVGEMEQNILVVELERAPDRVETSKVFGQQFSSFLDMLWLQLNKLRGHPLLLD
jgi:hypothetical protein